MGQCGDTINIQVSLMGDVVREAGFWVDGCAVTMACANAATALARGHTTRQVLSLVTPERIDEVLGGLPDDHEHCARLAVNALHGAIRDALLHKGDGWKRLYRT